MKKNPKPQTKKTRKKKKKTCPQTKKPSLPNPEIKGKSPMRGLAFVNKP